LDISYFGLARRKNIGVCSQPDTSFLLNAISRPDQLSPTETAFLNSLDPKGKASSVPPEKSAADLTI
jgi:hypothetical protein